MAIEGIRKIQTQDTPDQVMEFSISSFWHEVVIITFEGGHLSFQTGDNPHITWVPKDLQ